MAVRTNNISYPFANIRMENSLHKTSLDRAVQSFEQYSPLTVIDKNGVSLLIPSLFKFFSPILAKICGPSSSTDYISIITPDCTGSAILGLYELVSSGITNIAVMDHQCEMNQYEAIEEISDAGTLFGLSINPEAVSWKVKTEKLECNELSAPSERPANAVCDESSNGQDFQLDFERLNYQSIDCTQDDNHTKNPIPLDLHEGFDSEFISSVLFNSAQDENHTKSSIPVDAAEGCDSEPISSGHATVEDDKEKSISDVLAKNNSHTLPSDCSMEEYDKRVQDLIFLSETGSQREYSCKECSYSRARKDQVMEHVGKHIKGFEFLCNNCGKIYSTKHSYRRHTSKCSSEVNAVRNNLKKLGLKANIKKDMIKKELLGTYGKPYEETPKKCIASYVDYNVNIMSVDVIPKGEIIKADGAQKRKRSEEKEYAIINSTPDTTAAPGESPEERARRKEERARRKEEKKKKKKAKKEAKAAAAAVAKGTSVESKETIVYGDESGEMNRKKIKEEHVSE